MQIPVDNQRRELRTAGRRRATQQGSALLIVLVFAAIVAIMLYRELPVVAFEAQRQREELTVSRGNSYKRAVKLFVRKIGRFPSSLDELENTNRMRFLPHRYVDPLTGKDDWRLIHAGPGGVITDSKVANKPNGPAGALGQAAVFAGFNNSFTGDAAAAADAAAANAANPALRQRAAATKNASSVQSAETLGLPQTEDTTGQQPSAQLDQANLPPNALPPGTQSPGSQASGFGQGGAGSANNSGGLNGPTPPSGDNGINSFGQQLNNTNPQTAEIGPQQNAQQQNGQPVPQPNGLGNTASFGGAPSNLPRQAIGNGQLNGVGGIAGVASKALGSGIKSINDQTKYALWEFYYDMRKDQQAGVLGGGQQLPGTNNNPSNQNGAGGGFGAGSGGGAGSTFGNANSAFGSVNSFGASQSQSGFSYNGAQGSPQPAPVQSPYQQTSPVQQPTPPPQE